MVNVITGVRYSSQSAPKCNFFELSCWREEAQVLQDAEQKICSKGKGILQKIDYPTDFPVRLVSELSPTIIDELLIKPFDEYGRVKWFGLILGKASDLTLKENTEESIILNFSHWGRFSIRFTVRVRLSLRLHV